MINFRKPDASLVVTTAVIFVLALAGALSSRYASRLSSADFNTLLAPGSNASSTWELLREGPVVGRTVNLENVATYLIVISLSGGTLRAAIVVGKDGETRSARVLGSSSGMPYFKRLGVLIQGLGTAQSVGYSPLDSVLEPLVRNALDTIARAERDRRDALHDK
ncbi:MAG: hypothetical protein E4H20_03945 [Spirochaetales bacterium]|nr:MAG: hypothetical protein E4H20_03945 [Spirochaetales bacterium]